MSSFKMNLTAKELTERVLVPARILKQIEEFSVKRIKSFTRSGKSLPLERQPLAKLSEKYVQKRENYPSNAQLFKPKKSNLTYSGQLLESLNSRSNYKLQSVRVFVSGTRDDGKLNTDVAEWVRLGGRPFLGLDTKGKDRIAEIIIRDFRRRIKKKR